jgi:hypothetical protein
MVNYQTNWSFIDYTVTLLSVWFIMLGFTFLQVSSSVKALVESIDMREVVGRNILWFVSSSLAYAFFLYLFVHRIYYLAGFINFINLSIILCVSFISVAILLLCLRRRCFVGIRYLHTKKKVFILLFFLVCFLIPLVSGVVVPIIHDPNIVVSPSPKEISYVRGEQVQDVKNIKIYIKAVEGYAWNMEIGVEAPSSFYIWVDGTRNGTKKINFLEYDQVVSLPLEIQPSYTVRNGTYVVRIKWSYESASGHSTQKSTTITVLIGEKPPPPVLYFHWLLVIMVIIMFIFAVTMILRRPRVMRYC